MRTRPRVRPALLRFFPALLLALPALMRGAADPAPVAATIELPKLVVNDQRPLLPPESWRYARVPGLEILSGASERDTQKLLRDFRLFNDAVTVVWPAAKSRPLPPLTLVLCETGAQFAAFAPPQNGVATDLATLLLPGRDHTAIVLNFGLKAVTLNPAEVGEGDRVLDGDDLTGAAMRVDFYAQLRRQYVKYLLSLSQPRQPAWFEEGISQLLMGMQVDPKFIRFAEVVKPKAVTHAAAFNFAGAGPDDGPQPTPGEVLDEKDFNEALVRAGFLPLEQLFAVTHDSPEVNNPIAGKWAHQCAALVHMWLYGEGKEFNAGFAKFLARAQREPVTEAMFKECFGMNYRQMLTRLRGYLNDTAYQYQEFEAKKGGGLPEPKPLELRDATQPEIARLKGESLVLAGRPDAAYEEMRAGYARGPLDPALVASFGVLEARRGETKRAREFLEAADRLHAANPAAGLALARLRYADAQAKPGAAGGQLAEAQTRAVVAPLDAARRTPPAMPEVYELMTDAWLHSAATPAKPDLAMINQGVVLFPRRPLLLYQAAELNRRHGDPREARLMATAGVQLSRNEESRKAFQAILDALPAK